MTSRCYLKEGRDAEIIIIVLTIAKFWVYYAPDTIIRVLHATIHKLSTIRIAFL